MVNLKHFLQALVCLCLKPPRVRNGEPETFPAGHLASSINLEGYPRTESTAYPSCFDFRGTLGAQVNNPTWASYVQRLLADGYQKPRSGTDEGDHPPVTPLRSATEDMLGNDAWRLYEYICAHFIGTVSPDCKYVR
ncbi:PREDICTED: DNA topoisomerase [Prunus dulcis]|uniref:DNA topoisomerase n=1 Tax=Prunus dulcis TaxID=3755 RepID=A0A5E4GNA9_PRUDU|nr:hypothetical protein L3X38_003086 [Prunus dulcis]VVA41048.1 PREDICTED: DNA topoisomerase [Prunus dulcis]